MLDEQGLVLSGEPRAQLTIDLPPPSSNADGSVERLVRFGLPANRFPRWTESYLLYDEAAPKIASLRAEAHLSVRKRFFAERVLLTRGYGLAEKGLLLEVNDGAVGSMELTVSDKRYVNGKTDFTSATDVDFVGELTVADRARAVELIPPAVVGLTINLDRTDWVDAEGQTVDEMVVAESQAMEPVAGMPGAWRVLSSHEAPRLRFAPSGAPSVTAMLSGGLR